MASRGKAAPDRVTQQRLFASSGGYCQNPNCNAPLFRETGTEIIHVAELAHVFAANDDEALSAAFELTRMEGIIPALESAHALALLPKIKNQLKPTDVVVLTVSGRGDKDLDTYLKH